MAAIKVLTTAVIFYILNTSRDYWYPLIQWAVNITVIASISWYIGRRVTRYIICQKILPRVDSSDKAVLITGCDSGFGQMTALALNKIGFYIFAGCLDINGPGAKDLQKLAAKPSRVMLLQMNVTKDDEVTRAYEKVTEFISSGGSNVRQLFAIINNAGIVHASQIEWAKSNTLDSYSDHIEVNTFGVIRVTRKFLPLIRKSAGRIVNLSSILSRTTMEGTNAYSVSKVATSKFTEGLALELAPFGVQAIDVNPWFYKTPLLNAPAIVNGLVKRFNEAPSEVKDAYGDNELKRMIKSVLFSVSHPNTVIQSPEDVVDTLVDAVTSAEPDAVYRVISPGLGIGFWIINDFLPWDLVNYARRAVHKIPNLYQIDTDKYVKLKQ